MNKSANTSWSWKSLALPHSDVVIYQESEKEHPLRWKCSSKVMTKHQSHELTIKHSYRRCPRPAASRLETCLNIGGSSDLTDSRELWRWLCRVTPLQKFNDSPLQGFNVSTVQGFMSSKIQGSRIQESNASCFNATLAAGPIYICHSTPLCSLARPPFMTPLIYLQLRGNPSTQDIFRISYPRLFVKGQR